MSASGEAKVYRGRQLFDYIDGGADLYLEYGFKEVAVREYTTGTNQTIFANLYLMADPDAAFGIFSLTRRVDFRPYRAGTMGARNDYQIVFCKGDYFVDLQATAADSAMSQALEEICRRVDQGIQAKKSFPAILSLLPRPGFIPHSEVYVRGPLSLNSRHYVADQNLYALSDSTPAAMAYYHLREGGHPSLYMVAAYPDSSEAQRVFGELEKHYAGKAALGDTSAVKFQQTPIQLTFSTNEDIEVIIRRGRLLTSMFERMPFENR